MNPTWLAVLALGAAVALPFAAYEFTTRRRHRRERARAFRRKERIELAQAEGGGGAPPAKK